MALLQTCFDRSLDLRAVVSALEAGATTRRLAVG